VDEIKEHAQVREPEHPPQVRTKLLRNACIVEGCDELPNAALSKRCRLLAEQRKRVRGVPQTSELGSEQLPVPTQELELGFEQRADPPPEVGRSWTDAHEALVLALSPLVVSLDQRVLRSASLGEPALFAEERQRLVEIHFSRAVR
jgi:hypothetical protein